jgi:hypothetical protein
LGRKIINLVRLVAKLLREPELEKVELEVEELEVEVEKHHRGRNHIQEKLDLVLVFLRLLCL